MTIQQRPMAAVAVLSLNTRTRPKELKNMTKIKVLRTLFVSFGFLELGCVSPEPNESPPLPGMPNQSVGRVDLGTRRLALSGVGDPLPGVPGAVGVTAPGVPVGPAHPEPSDAPLLDAGVSVLSDARAPFPADAQPPQIIGDGGSPARLPIHAFEDGLLLSEPQLWQRLGTAPVICFGELHDEASHHDAQLRGLRELTLQAREAGQVLGVGLEMFQRPFQSALSGFVESRIDEETLLRESEYATRWGYDFSLYRPLLTLARDQSLPTLALNAPTELTRQIGRTGLASLDAGQLASLPELDLQDPEHRAYILGLFGVLPEHDVEVAIENLYAAQTTWDETMAQTSSDWLTSDGAGARLVVLAGLGHCHRSAIPRRITRRTGLPVVSVMPIFASDLELEPLAGAGYDVLLVLEDRAQSN
jgi:uncharacterized iron-regulated protein